MNYLGLIWEDSPDKYTAFENGYYPSCNFKYQNTIFSINYKPDLEYFKEFTNSLKNNMRCDFFFKRIPPPGGFITKMITYHPQNQIYKHIRYTPLYESDLEDEDITFTYEKQLSDKERLEIANEFQRFIDQCKDDMK